MKLTDYKNINSIIKGTISLFLFLLLYQYGSSQAYVLEIIPEQNTSKEIKKDFLLDISYKRLYKDSIEINNELIKNLNLIRSEGYIAASYDSIIYDTTSVKAFLFIGKQFLCSDINLSGTGIDTKKYRSEIEKIKKNSFNLTELYNLYENIMSDLEDRGYPFALIIPENVEFSDSILNMDIRIEKNLIYRFNKLYVKGKAKKAEHYIKRYISLYEGDLYNESLVSGINKKLEDLSFLKIIRTPEVEFYENKADVYLYLDKKKSNLFNGIIGFADKDEESGIAFTGELNLKLINNFNRGELINFHWKSVGEGSQKLTSSFNYPYMFKSPFSLDMNFSLDKKDTTFLALRSNLGISYSFRNNDKIKAYYVSHNSRIISQSYTDSLIFSDAKTSMFGLAYQTENLDYVYNPRKGFLFYGEMAKGKRSANDIKSDYFEFSTLFDSYIPLYRNFIINIKLDNKFSFSDVIRYENEMFRVGGYNSLRGFAEDNFFVNEYSLLSVELRYLYEKNSNVFLFADAARLRFHTLIQNSIKYPYSFGLGTNLSTKAGIFSISYALGTIDNNPFQLSESKIHIGYINRF